MEFHPILTLAPVLAVRYRPSLSPQRLRITADAQVASPMPIAEALLPVTMWHVACGLAADSVIPAWLGSTKKLSAPDPRDPVRSSPVAWEFEVSAMSPRFLMLVAQVASFAAAPGTPMRAVVIEGDTSDQSFDLVNERHLIDWAADERNLVVPHAPVAFALDRRYEDDRLGFRVRFEREPGEDDRTNFSSHVDSFLAIMDQVSNGRDGMGMHEEVSYAWAADEVTVRVERFDHDADIAVDALLNTLSSFHVRAVPVAHALILG